MKAVGMLVVSLRGLCFNMVSFRGKKKLEPLPDRSPLGV